MRKTVLALGVALVLTLGLSGCVKSEMYEADVCLSCDFQEGERLLAQAEDYLRGTNGVEVNKDKTVVLLKQSAALGNAQAAFWLGNSYASTSGWLVEQDMSRALAYYQQAEASGDVHVLAQLGRMYAQGVAPFEQDGAKALALYNQVLEAGNMEVLFDIGDVYYEGQGVAKDDVQALAWFKKAAEHGDEWARYKVALMFDQGEGNGGAPDFEMAWQWYEPLGSQDDGLFKEGKWAENNPGLLYEQGDVVPQSYEKARQWYERGAKNGYAWARYGLGRLYLYGWGVEQDSEQAVYWLNRAAWQGNGSAQVLLAMAYMKGNGVERDEAKAKVFAQMACDVDHSKYKYIGCRLLEGWAD